VPTAGPFFSGPPVRGRTGRPDRAEHLRQTCQCREGHPISSSCMDCVALAALTTTCFRWRRTCRLPRLARPGHRARWAQLPPAVQHDCAPRFLGLDTEGNWVAPLALVAILATGCDHELGSARSVSNAMPPHRLHGAGTGIGSRLVTISWHVLHVQDRLRVRPSRRTISSGCPRRSITSRSSMPYILGAGREMHNHP
jgi:hypothetical protein